MRVQIPIANGNSGNSVAAIDSRYLKNMYAEPSMGKASFVLKKRPGLVVSSTVNGSFGSRGLYTTSTNRLFGVRGSKLFEVGTDNAVTDRGTLGTVYGPVKMTDNGIHLVIADGSVLYQYELATNALIAIADPQAPQNTPAVCFIDGYIFAFNPDSANLGEYQYSGVDDVTSWSSLDIGIAQKDPDRLVSMIANNGNLWLFGSRSYEVHGNQGTPTDTWIVIGGANGEIGCAAKNSVEKYAGQVYWLGANKEGHAKIYRSNGFGIEEISTFKEVSRITSIYDISDAIGFTYQIGGHAFYAITFQTGDVTLVYNISTGLWHEETWRNPDTFLQERHLPVCHSFFNGKNWYGDRQSGNLYTLDNEVYEDNEEPIICEITFPNFEDQKKPIFWNYLEIDCEMGVGDYVTDPMVQIRYSDDGGNSWSTYRSASMGLAGHTNRRVKFNRLGCSKFGERIFQLRYSGNTKFNIVNNAIADIEIGV